MSSQEELKWNTKTRKMEDMEKPILILQHAHLANKVSLAMMDLIIDFVIPENFSTFIAEKVVPLSSWFPTAKKIKKTEAKAFNTTSRILFKKPK